MAKYLRKKGYSPVVFCCNNKHNPGTEEWFETDKLWEERSAEDIDVPYVFIRGRRYVGNGRQRILNMIDFYRNVKKTASQYIETHERPDVILASSVHPFTLVAGIQLARRFDVKCICEVRDLWPESLVAYNIAGKSNPFVVFLRLLEKWVYKHADSLVFTMEGAYDYIKERHWEKAVPREKVFFVNNGVDLESFDYDKEHYAIEDKDLDNQSIIKVVYVGSIRRVNNLNNLIDIAKEIKDPRFKFLIWGDGDEKATLERRVAEENIINVSFKGRVEKKYVANITCRADINILHCYESPIFRFGISMNKLFDYFAAGKPIYCDFDCRYNPAVKVGACIDTCGVDAKEKADVMEKMFTTDLYDCGKKARVAAEVQYNCEKLTGLVIDVINL